MSYIYWARVRARWIITYDDQVMVIKQKNTICLPWWTLEIGELPKETLYRELKEELWIIPQIWDLKLIMTFNFWSDDRWLEYVYHITNGQDYRNNDKRSEATHGFEIDEILWRSINEIWNDVRPVVLKEMPKLLFDSNLWYREITI